MFSSIRNDVIGRLLDARKFFAHGASAVDTRTAKGLMFVQLYAAYEFAVCSSVRAAISRINDSATPHAAAHPGVLSMSLKSRWQSVMDAGRSRHWKVLHEFAVAATSADPLCISDTVLPDDGTHFRASHLQVIWDSFGILSPIVPHPRLVSRIDESVEHRNAIAHGRETAEAIGGRFTIHEMSGRIDDMRLVILHLIGTLEIHCSSAKNFCR